MIARGAGVLLLALALAAPPAVADKAKSRPVPEKRQTSEWHTYGTSVTLGQCGRICGAGFGYADAIAAAMGVKLERHAVSASDSQTQVGEQIYPRTIRPLSVHFGDPGGSDFLWFGGQVGRPLPGGDSDLADFERTQIAGLAWLALTDSHKVKVADSDRVSRTGAWETKATQWWDELISSMVGATLSTSFVGSAVYVGYSNRHYARDGGKFKITVDGKDYGPCDTFSSRHNPLRHPAEAHAQAIRLSGFKNERHALTVTVLSGAVQVSWIGSPGTVGENAAGLTPETPEEGPLVFVSSVMRLSPDYYRDLLPFADPGTGDLYDARQRQIVQTLARDGLSVRLVDARAAYDPEKHRSDDLLHPSPAGHRVIADAFLKEIRAALAARATGR